MANPEIIKLIKELLDQNKSGLEINNYLTDLGYKNEDILDAIKESQTKPKNLEKEKSGSMKSGLIVILVILFFISFLYFLFNMVNYYL